MESQCVRCTMNRVIANRWYTSRYLISIDSVTGGRGYAVESPEAPNDLQLKNITDQITLTFIKLTPIKRSCTVIRRLRILGTFVCGCVSVYSLIFIS